MKTIRLSTLALSLCFLTGRAFAAVLGTPGQSVTYALDGDPAARPEFERSHKLTVVETQITLGPAAQVEGKEFQWASLNFTRLNGQKYQLWLLMDAWPQKGKAPAVARYLWREPDWPDAVSFVNESTGAAVLPRWSLWEFGWPLSTPTTLVAGEMSPDHIQFQGWPFKRSKVESGVDAAVPANSTELRLNPDLMIGFMNNERDVDGQDNELLPNKKYRYQPETEEDWRDKMAAGFNLHRAAKHPDWLWRSNVYSSRIYSLQEDWPASLYRSNFWGRATYVDEPGIAHRALYNQRNELAGKLTPAEAAKALEGSALAPVYVEAGNYSALWINKIVDQQFGRGSIHIVEKDFPFWEGVWPDAWYELAPEYSVGGIVDEGCVTQLAALYNMAFGTQIPPTIENDCALRIAVLRGACRNFHKKWGVAVYSDLDAKRRQETLPLFYKAGATYFWFWSGWASSTENVNVPYPYQIESAKAIRQAYQQNPKRDMDALLNKARTVIVLPYGYTFFPDVQQNIGWLHLERKNPAGQTYRQVLANATTEAERLLRAGTDFDVAIDEPRFKPVGYDELIYIQEDGTERIVHPGKPDETLKQARTPDRPAAGALPTFKPNIDPQDSALPVTVNLSIKLPKGSDVLTVQQVFGDKPQPWVFWEIFAPNDSGVTVTGADTSFQAKVAGTYRARASIADSSGRPVTVEQTFEVRPR